MKRNFVFLKLISLLLLAVIFAISLVGCNEPQEEVDEENLTLISNGVANFQIVTTSELDNESAAKVEELIKKLKNLGLDIADTPVSDADEAAIKSCEIIFGTGAKGREGCNVDIHTVGADGYSISIVGDRVIVAAGSAERYGEAIELVKKKVLGITSKVDSLAEATVKVERKYKANVLTEYPVVNIYVGNNSLSDYCFSYDSANEAHKSVVNTLRDLFYEKAGFWLPLENELAEGTVPAHKIIIKNTEATGDESFKAYVSGADFVIECAADEKFAKGVNKFINSYFDNTLTVIRFYSDKPYSYDVMAIRYSDFGAVGDGKTDDFEAILNAHEAANKTGTKVMADEGAKYYIGSKSYGKTAVIQTDVDWVNAEFIIDDMQLTPKGKRGNSVFAITPSKGGVTYKASNSPTETTFSKGLTLSIGDTALPEELKKFITEPCIVVPYNENHKIFVRYGNNTGTNPVHEVLMVNADGTIDTSVTPVMWDYTDITKIVIYYTNDAPITVKNGEFTTLANQVYTGFTEEELKPTSEGGGGWATGSQYYYYGRGIATSRSHVTVKNVKHYIEMEGTSGYPYNGWYGTNNCYDVLYENCVMTGHKGYFTESNRTTMGSYDIGIGMSVGITFKGCVQSNNIDDTAYWGVMCSNFGRNLTYDGCTLSRFDAHEGVYNATIKNTTIGHTLSLIGAGVVHIENTTKTGGTSFISFRGDYGYLWRGDVIIKNCTMKTESNMPSVPILAGGWNESWVDWDFGYDLYMPQNITIDNFKCDNSDIVLFRWTGLTQAATTCSRPVVTPKTVTITNQTKTLYFADKGNYLYELKNTGVITVNGVVN